jgi:hypothetical protein
MFAVTAHFTDNGDHNDTHVPYDRNDVPAPVTNKVKYNYPGYGNADFTRIDRADGNFIPPQIPRGAGDRSCYD